MFMEDSVYDQLAGEMDSLSLSVSSKVGVSSEVGSLLLRKHNWSETVLMDKFKSLRCSSSMICNSDNIRISRLLGKEIIKSTAICSLCCDISSVAGLECGHIACTNCWNSYIRDKVNESGTVDIQCVQFTCNLMLTEKQVMSFIQQDDIKTKYRRLLTESFIVASGTPYKWCPGEGCGKILKKPFDFNRVVCGCGIGGSVCFDCPPGQEDHSPLPCHLLKEWFALTGGNGRPDCWIAVNTRSCTGCQSPIERNGGCAHMTCTRCPKQFCWECLSDWTSNHSCPVSPRSEHVSDVRIVEPRRSFDYYQSHLRTMKNKKPAVGLSSEMCALGKGLRCAKYANALSFFVHFGPATNILLHNLEQEVKQSVADLGSSSYSYSCHSRISRLDSLVRDLLADCEKYKSVYNLISP